MSLAENSPRPCEYITQAGFHSVHRSQCNLIEFKTVLLNTDLDAGAGQIDIGSPLTLHPTVLRGPGVHHWRLAMGCASFSLGHILVRPGTAAGYNLWLWPLFGNAKN